MATTSLRDHTQRDRGRAAPKARAIDRFAENCGLRRFVEHDVEDCKDDRTEHHCARERNEPWETSWTRPEVKEEVKGPSATSPQAQFVSDALEVVSTFAHHCALAGVEHARSGKRWLDKSARTQVKRWENARPQLDTVWKAVRSDLVDLMCVARKFALVNAQRIHSRRSWLGGNGRKPLRILTRSRTTPSLAQQRILIANRSVFVAGDGDRAREEALRPVQPRAAPLDSGSNTLAPQIVEPPVSVPAGPFVLEPLPWLVGALAPVISSRTMQVHHGCHYAACIALANQLSRNHKELAGKNALGVVCWARDRACGSELFEAASEAWNHALFWKSLTPSKQRPCGELRRAMDRAFGDFASFADRFACAGAAHSGSGWLWLVANRRKQVKILTTSGADCPEYREGTCLLAIDLWEHSYYFDHQNRRREYLDALIDRRLDWEFAETRFRLASEQGANGRRESQRPLPQNRGRNRKRQIPVHQGPIATGRDTH